MCLVNKFSQQHYFLLILRLGIIICDYLLVNGDVGDNRSSSIMADAGKWRRRTGVRVPLFGDDFIAPLGALFVYQTSVFDTGGRGLGGGLMMRTFS